MADKHQKKELINLKYNLKLNKDEAIAYLKDKMSKPQYDHERKRHKKMGLPSAKRMDCRQHSIEYYQQLINYLVKDNTY